MMKSALVILLTIMIFPVFASSHIDYEELLPPCPNRPEIVEGSEAEGYYSIRGELVTLVKVIVEKGGDYSNCDLRHATFTVCEYCDFENSKLPKYVMQSLENSFLKGVDLTFADIEDVNLKNTVLVNAKLSDSRIGLDLYKSSWRDNIDFTGADLSRSYITALKATWTDSIFKNTKLNEAVISIKVQGLDFSGSDWTNANVLGGFFINSDLSNGNFKGTYFIDGTFRDVDFSNSNFDGAIFFKVILDEVDFTNSKVENAVFYDVDLTNTNIEYGSKVVNPDREVYCDRHGACNLLQWYTTPKIIHGNEPKISEEPIISSPSVQSEPQLDETKLPEWIRNIFIWYAENRISEDELIGALQFLIEQGIIKV